MVLPLNSWRGQVEIGARNGEDVSQLLAEAQWKATAYQACLTQEDISTLNEADLNSKVTICAMRADPSW